MVKKTICSFIFIMLSTSLAYANTREISVSCPQFIGDRSTGDLYIQADPLRCYARESYAKKHGLVKDNTKTKPLKYLSKKGSYRCPNFIATLSNSKYKASKNNYYCFRDINKALQSGFRKIEKVKRTKAFELSGTGDGVTVPFEVETDLVKATVTLDPETCPTVPTNKVRKQIYRIEAYKFKDDQDLDYNNVSQVFKDATSIIKYEEIDGKYGLNRVFLGRYLKSGFYHYKIKTGASYTGEWGYQDAYSGDKAPGCKWKIVVEPAYDFSEDQNAFTPILISGEGYYSQDYVVKPVFTEFHIKFDPATCPEGYRYSLGMFSKDFFNLSNTTFPFFGEQLFPVKADPSTYEERFFGKAEHEHRTWFNIGLPYFSGEGLDRSVGGDKCQWTLEIKPAKI